MTCEPEKSETIARLLSWVFGWIIPLSALFLLIVFGSLGQSNTITTWIGFLGCYLVSVILHELGHYFVGRAVGVNPVLVSIGHGDLLLEKFAFNTTWRIHALAFSGAVYAYPLSKEGIRGRMLAMTAAAPAVNGLIALICLALINDPELKRLQYNGTVDFEALILNFFIANCFLFVSSLITFYPSPEIEKDGRLIVNLLFGHSESIAHDNCDPSEPTSRSDDNSTTSKPSENSKPRQFAAKRWPIPAVLAIHRQMIRCRNAKPEDKLKALDGFATAVLLYSDSKHLHEADEYSRELIAAKPDDPSAMGTRGSILVELGDFEGGIRLLEPAYQQSEVPFDRGVSAVFLAAAYARRKEPNAAACWLDLAKKADPTCVDFERLEKFLKDVASSSAQEQPETANSGR